MPKVSFVVPVYNAEKYLRRCLDSIEQQTERNFQAVLVDDGSTDSSGDICKEYVQKDSRFTYHFQENAFLPAARNTGLKFAIGEYISFVDSDDYIDANYVEVLIGHAQKTQADILCFGVKRNEGMNTVFEVPEKKLVEVSGETVLAHFCTDWLRPMRRSYVCSKLFRRDFINDAEVRFNPALRAAEDRNFCYKLLFQSRRTAYIPEAPYFYYQHEESLTQSAYTSSRFINSYIESYLDNCEYWDAKGQKSIATVKPIVLIHALKSALHNTRRAVGDLEVVADIAVKAFENFPLANEFELYRLKNAVSVYSEICELDWEEKSELWLFALSMLEGKEGIFAWLKSKYI